MEIGVISDTHGLLRPEAVTELEGVDLILHAGDIGTVAILDRLRAIAPVHAVRGNTDRAEGVRALPLRELVHAGDVSIVLIHILEDLDVVPSAVGASVVVYGHTHVPAVELRRGVVYLNPGSAGPRRPGRPISLARLSVHGAAVNPRIVTLQAG